MKEQDFFSSFEARSETSKNSYQILDEVSRLLGLGGEDLSLLFKLLRRTDHSIMVFNCGHLWIYLDRNPDNTEQPDQPNIVMTLQYEKGRTQREFHYHYNLKHLETLLHTNQKCGSSGE